MAFSNILNVPDVTESLDFCPSLMDYSCHSGNTSSPTTLFHSSLLSPANVSHGLVMTPSTSTGSEGHETVAYMRLLCQSQQRQKELSGELDSLRYVSSSLLLY